MGISAPDLFNSSWIVRTCLLQAAVISKCDIGSIFLCKLEFEIQRYLISLQK